jgi:ubiquitin-activating enzyme E1
MKNIDTDLYSRQIKAYGIETMSKLQNLRILILGMRGLGAEIAKNIILSGVKEVKIFDEAFCEINDLGNNFYLCEKNIGERRDFSCIEKLKELNSYVNVEIFKGNIIEEIDNFDLIFISEIMNKDLLFKIDEKCYELNKSFIYCLNLGLSCFIFSDFGKRHIITDPTGKEKKMYFIKSIDKSGIITIDQSNRDKLALKTGDFVKFKEVEGIDELNDGKPRKIRYISENSFSIEDKYNYEEYKVGGIVEEIIFPKEIKYTKLKDSFYIPYLETESPDINDYTKEGRNELLHLSFLAIHDYYTEKKKLPEINDLEEAKLVLEKAKIIYDKAKSNKEYWINNIENFDEQIILNVARWSKCEISPICSFIGGIAAQEAVKKTGKYNPIKQYLWFDFFETIEDLEQDVNRDIFGSRYDDQIAIYGQEIQKKLNKLNIFIIGAGAIGCEFIKNFSLMGISINKDSKTIITDNDMIETSNLNRQFLFRNKDIGQSKSKIASEQAKKMNKKFNCQYLEMFVNEENEEYFNEKFWESQDFIFTAVDSIKSRKYIDNQCTKYSKHLIDTGTLGTSASCQIIIPFKTSCYNDNENIPQYSIPMCTLRNFPSKIEHCIEWGLNKFNDFFISPVEDLKKFLENKEEFFNYIEKEDTSDIIINKMKEIKKLLEIIIEDSFDKIIKNGIEVYFENYIFQIKKLIEDFPHDFTNKDGSLFWSGSKRFPNIINYDINNQDCSDFIKYYSILLAKSINVKIIDDDDYIKKIIEKTEIPEYISKNNIIPSREKELEEISSLKISLNNFDNTKIDKNNLIPQYFEKDNDSNKHVFFINLCSNLRANNYKIEKSNEQQTKMIAGRIVPAIATTTASITGFACIQLMTLLHSDDVSLVKNCYFNTSFNIYNINNPSDVINMEDQEYNPLMDGPTIAVPKGWTVWDIINIKGPMTCQEFIDYFKQVYNVNISGIACNFKNIFQIFMPSKKKKLPLHIEKIYENTCALKKEQTSLWLEISGEINNINVVMPKIRYTFK